MIDAMRLMAWTISGKRMPLMPKTGIERGTEDHGTDVFCSGRLEDVRATAGAVADVVADEVSDDGGIARVVFGDAGFDFADEVGADVSGLGVNAAAKLREERDERRSEAEADELIRDRLRVGESAEEEEQCADAEQRKRHDDEAGHGTATQRGLQRFIERCTRGGSSADVRANRNVHAGEAGEAGADSADQERDDSFERVGRGARRQVIAAEDDDREHDREDADRLVLPRKEGFCTFTDGV